MNDSLSKTGFVIKTAILLLPENLDCYWKNLANVPFLVRNILTLQRADITKLVLWMQNPLEDTKDFQLRIDQDPRIILDIKWANISTTFDAHALILDGSTLLDKSAIVEAMTSSHPVDISKFPFFPEALKRSPDSQGKNLFNIVSPHESSRLTSEEDFQAAEERLLKSVGLSNDSPMDRLLTRFISRQLTRLLLKTPLTPNQITFLSMLIGLSSAWCFYQGTYYSGISGALLLLLSAWVDCTDGEIARLKFMETPWGARFDILCDNIVHFSVFFSIGMGLFFATGDPLYKLYGGLAVYGSLVAFIILSGIIVKKKQEAGQGASSTANLADHLANRDFTYFLLAMACVGRLDIFILLAAVGSNIFAIYLMYQKWGPTRRGINIQ